LSNYNRGTGLLLGGITWPGLSATRMRPIDGRSHASTPSRAGVNCRRNIGNPGQGASASTERSFRLLSGGEERLMANTALALDIFADAMKHVEQRGSRHEVEWQRRVISKISVRATCCVSRPGSSYAVALASRRSSRSSTTYRCASAIGNQHTRLYRRFRRAETQHWHRSGIGRGSAP